MLKIQTKVRTKTITNKDEVFKDTDFSEVEFSVDVKELKYDELMSIEKASEKTDDLKAMMKKFLSTQIISWTGFYDENEKEIPFSKKASDQIFDYTGNYEFAVKLVEAIQKAFIDEKEEELKKK